MEKEKLRRNFDLIIAGGMLIMFAYGIFVGSLFGNYGYLPVLVSAIIVSAYLIHRRQKRKAGVRKR